MPSGAPIPSGTATRAALVVAVLLAALVAGALPGDRAAAGPARARAATTASAPPYVTLLFSRSQWVSSLRCERLPRTVTLHAVAAELRARGLTGTGTVVTGHPRPRGRLCLPDLDVHGDVLRRGGVRYGSWRDLRRLRDRFGWTFVSHSRTYRDLTTLTAEEQRDEACGSLDDLRAHGHLRGDGLFAYPNNLRTDAMQRDVVASCFAFGRAFGGVNERASTGPPWFQRTTSVNGGNCNAPSRRCFTGSAPQRYTSPVVLGDRMAALRPDQWFSLQHYRFVTGRVKGRWNCRAARWRRHWTGSAEEYCWKDYRAILDRIPAEAVVTDPRTVADAWGRTDDER